MRSGKNVSTSFQLSFIITYKKDLKVNILSWVFPLISDHFPVSSASRSGTNLVSCVVVEVIIFGSDLLAEVKQTW